jgi:hypothetical protein
MLSVPKLDDSSYEKLVWSARGRIPSYTGEWTDLNDHDPGMTVLQTFAWLADTLNYYIDATSEEHRLSYLRLLGLIPERKAAQSIIALFGESNEISVAKGAKLAAGDTVFEIAESYTAAANRMTALFRETTGGVFTDLTSFAGTDGQYAPLFTHEADRDTVVYIGFECALEGEVRFYADVQTHPARNRFTDDFALAELGWEYFDGEDWRRAATVHDGTGGFLKSGFISLVIDGEVKTVSGHPALPQAYYLRVKLLGGAYDATAKIGKIYVNCIRAVQTDTLAQSIELEFDGKLEIPIDYHIREEDIICVGVEDGDGYSLWFEHTFDKKSSLCEVLEGEHPRQRVVRFNKRKFGKVPAKGQKILITITDAGCYSELHLGTASGFAGQRLELDFEDVFELRLALSGEKDGRAHLEIWNHIENLAEAACDARVFALNHEKGEVLFGDGIAGAQPDAGRVVTAVTAKTSLLGEGNVRAEQINRFMDSGLSDLSACNPESAKGGINPKTSAELEAQIEEKIYKTTRAVTTQDYIDIVKATPGLMIDRVNVISAGEYARFYAQAYSPGAVLLAVKPLSEHRPRPVLSEAYRSRIHENIERYRLLTTDVRIIPVKYVRVDVEGHISLDKNIPKNISCVEEKLSGLIDFTSTDKFATGVVYGRVFSHLEMLDCVLKVNRLSLSCIGDGAHKTEQGDLVIYPDTLAWLGNVNIEFV